MLNTKNYLKRISFHGGIQINPGTLKTLHRKHIQNVPFENLDIHLGKKIILDLKKIEDKIVSNRRGGFCYELNGLFGALLCQLGFDVKMISARVFGNEVIGREFDHMALIVRLDHEWLVDVGFGNNFLEPIQLQLDTIQIDPAGSFRIKRHDSKYLRLDNYENERGFTPQYAFSLEERKLEDFADMCEYHQTSPESSFTRGRVCTIATVNGRITLSDQVLIETTNGQKAIQQLTDDADFNQLLGDRFGYEIGTNP